MLSLSPLSEGSSADDLENDQEDFDVMVPPANDSMSVDAGCNGVASRLAFTFDLTKLDEDGKPKKKMPRRWAADPNLLSIWLKAC